MGLYGKNWRWDTHFEEIEYLEGNFFAIGPYCLVFVFYSFPKVPTGKFIFYRPTKFFQKTSKPNSCYWFLYSSKVIHILNSCFQILYMCFLKRFTYLFSILAYYACAFPVIIHAGSLFFALRHVFSDLLYIPNYDFWIIRMYFLLFCTYLIPVFELSACISWFFAHTRFLFFNFRTCIFKCFA